MRHYQAKAFGFGVGKAHCGRGLARGSSLGTAKWWNVTCKACLAAIPACAIAEQQRYRKKREQDVRRSVLANSK